MTAKIKLSFLLGVSLVATGCSRWQLAVRFADNYLMYQVDSALDLNRDQKSVLKPQVQQALAGIKENEAKKLADLLEKAEATLRQDGDLTSTRIRGWNAEAQKIALQGVQRFEAATLELMGSLTQEQEQHFVSYFNKRTEKMKKEIDTPDKSFEKDLERTLRTAQFFIADLTRDQRKRIEEFVRKNPSDFDSQMENRESLFQSFVALEKQARPAWIRTFLSNPDELRSPKAKAASENRQQKLAELFEEIWSRMPEKQRERFLVNLKDKAAEFRRL